MEKKERLSAVSLIMLISGCVFECYPSYIRLNLDKCVKNRVPIGRRQTCWATVCRCFWVQRWWTTHPRTTILLATTTPQVRSSLVWTASPLNMISHNQTKRASPLVCELIEQQQRGRARGSEGKYRPLHGDSCCSLRFNPHHLSIILYETNNTSLSTSIQFQNLLPAGENFYHENCCALWYFHPSPY